MTSTYRDETVERVRDSNDIVSVVSEYVKLKKIGNRYVGLCPFHNERTPSFSVSPSRQLFYCFGCHTGGNAFTFIMKMEGLTFQEAVRRLGERAGIDVPSPAETDEDRAERERRERIFEINAQAMAYYRQVLLVTRAAGSARDYLERRGVGAEVQDRFGIGYAPEGWGHLMKALATKGITAGEAVDAGLAFESSDGGRTRFRDRFRNRIMFPIVNAYGRVVGFGARALGDEQPKYLNSPESAVFSKRSNLYGINLAADSIRSRGVAVLVEGYLDVIASHQAGETNVVATLGTALTVEQIRLLKRYSNRLVLCYDGDAAGVNATARGIEIAKPSGLEIRVAALPDGHDPDSLARSGGAQALRAAFEQAIPYLRYQLEQALAGVDPSDLDSRVKVSQEVVEILSGVSNDIERAEYVREMSGRLGVEPGAMTAEVRKAMAKRRGAAEVRRAGEKAGGAPAAQDRGLVPVDDSVWGSKAYLEVEQALIRLSASSDAVRDRVLSEVGIEGFKVPGHAELLRLAVECGRRGEVMTPAGLVDSAPPELRSYAAEVLMAAKPWEGDPGAVDRSIHVWRQFNVKHRLNEIDTLIRGADASGDHEKVRTLQAEQQKLRMDLGRDVTLY